MIESSARLGRHRWTIERTGAWLGGWRRLRIGYERSSERFYAVVLLACAVICFNTLQQLPWQSFAVSGSSGWQEQQLRSLGASADRGPGGAVASLPVMAAGNPALACGVCGLTSR